MPGSVAGRPGTQRPERLPNLPEVWEHLEVRTTLCAASNVRIPSLNSVQLERPCVVGSVSGSPGTPWSENDLVYSDMLYRGLTLSVGTQRAMPEAQSTWTKGIGAESNQQYKHSNEVLEPKPKDGNVHMTRTPQSVEN